MDLDQKTWETTSNHTMAFSKAPELQMLATQFHSELKVPEKARPAVKVLQPA